MSYHLLVGVCVCAGVACVVPTTCYVVGSSIYAIDAHVPTWYMYKRGTCTTVVYVQTWYMYAHLGWYTPISLGSDALGLRHWDLVL